MKTQTITLPQNTLRTLGLFGLFMILTLASNPLLAQTTEQTISGVVNSTDGPVFGAAIVLKGTATGVVSNENGAFTFPEELKENDVLVISYLGYETAEITISNDTTIVNPFLQDIPIVIVAALRTENTMPSIENK